MPPKKALEESRFLPLVLKNTGDSCLYFKMEVLPLYSTPFTQLSFGLYYNTILSLNWSRSLT